MITWVEVPGWPYEASNTGDVRRIGSSRTMKPMLTGKKRRQYATVRLCRDGEYKDFKVHRLICELFNGAPPPGGVACHRDDDPTNNAASNLYWGTWQDNAQDTGRRKPTAAVAQAIRDRRAAGERGVDLAREYGISQQLVCDIVKGRCYGYL